MRLWELEEQLKEVDGFENPQIDLEQVATNAHLAANFISLAHSRGDIEGKDICDLGVGPGILSIGAILMGANVSLGVDVDQDALDVAWINLRKLDITSVDLVRADVQTLQTPFRFDTALMNPPFGTRNSGIDTAFVVKAMSIANVVYSLHKTSTRAHFVRLAEEHGWTFETLAELKYDIPKQFKYHKKKVQEVYVDLYRFSHRSL